MIGTAGDQTLSISQGFPRAAAAAAVEMKEGFAQLVFDGVLHGLLWHAPRDDHASGCGGADAKCEKGMWSPRATALWAAIKMSPTRRVGNGGPRAPTFTT